MTDHPLTETAAAELWDEHVPPQLNFQGWTWDDRRSILDALRAAFDAGREYERAATVDDREAEKRRTDIAESDAESLYERCERIRRERDVFFRQCEYALDRAEKAEADLAEYMRAAADSRPVVDSQ